jgi:LemA protein
MKNSTLLLIGAAILLFFYGGCKYNGMVGSNESVSEKWGKVQTAYQYRNDLTKALIETVKGETAFEKEVLLGVTNARASATKMTVDASNLTPEKIKEFNEIQGQFGSAIGRLMSISEQYPNLKANQAFRDFSTAYSGMEGRIKVARDEFNKSVKDFNVSVKTFPSNIFASMFGFTAKGYFESDKGAEKAPEVNFGAPKQ